MEKFKVELKKWKLDALCAELDLYREVTDIEVAKAEVLTNNKLRVAEIERLQKEKGFALKVSEELKADFPILLEEVEVGQIVILTEDELNSELEKQAQNARVAQFDERLAKLMDIGDDIPVSADIINIMEDAEFDTYYDGRVADKKATDDAKEKAEKEAKAKKDAESNKGEEVAVVEMVYQGMTVTFVGEKLVNGRNYKEIILSNGETHTLTNEDFINKVTER